jgi:DNA-binding YbaB/EbfC family protein
MNMNNLLKQAQAMQKKMLETQEELSKKEYEGTSGAGAVKVLLSGKSELKSITLDPEIVNKDDIEMLEDLIKAAFNDAKTKLDSASEGSMSGLMGGMQMPPGMKFPF